MFVGYWLCLMSAYDLTIRISLYQPIYSSILGKKKQNKGRKTICHNRKGAWLQLIAFNVLIVVDTVTGEICAKLCGMQKRETRRDRDWWGQQSDREGGNTRTQAREGINVWGVGGNVRGMAALGSAHPYNGSWLTQPHPGGRSMADWNRLCITSSEIAMYSINRRRMHKWDAQRRCACLEHPPKSPRFHLNYWTDLCHTCSLVLDSFLFKWLINSLVCHLRS